MKAINYKLVNIAIILIITFFLYQTKDVWIFLFNKIFLVLKPFIISFIIAYLFYPLVKFFKKKLNSTIATIIVIILVIIVFSFLLKITLPIIIKESLSLIRQIVYFINNINLDNTFLELISIEKVLNHLLNNLYLYIENSTINVLSSSINLLLQIVIIVILSGYFLFNYEKIRRWIKQKVKNIELYSCLKKIDEDLSSYITGIGIIMLVEIVEYTIIYAIIGHPNFLLIAILASVTTIIPFFGGMFTNIVALITASVISRKLFILTALIIILAPLLDCYLIQPRIYKRTNKISPIVTIIVVIIGGLLFKTIGIMIAVPLYIIIKNIVGVYQLKKS
ncbi:MAG TPA: AI-2E family transporter [Bacilli bacterium]|nr:AI-2E family transporter [Bacilli bacterium]